MDNASKASMKRGCTEKLCALQSWLPEVKLPGFSYFNRLVKHHLTASFLFACLSCIQASTQLFVVRGAGSGCKPQAAAQHQGWEAEGTYAQSGGTAAPGAHALADGAPPALHL